VDERLRVYPRIFLVLYVLIGGWWVLSGPGLLDRSGNPVGGDFVTFWAAGSMLLDGVPEQAWNLDAIHAVESQVLGVELPDDAAYGWFYPPPAMMGAALLALAPYALSLAGWLLVSLGAYVAVCRSIRPDALSLGLVLAFPGLFQNLIHGQNGCLTLALLGGGLVLVDRRPVLAGALMGLLVYKPHLLPLAGVALLFGRRWKALAGLTLSVTGLVGVSVVVVGQPAWGAFFDTLAFALSIVDHAGPEWWSKMPSTASMLRLLGLPPAIASGANTAVGVAAVAIVAGLWARDVSAPKRNAAVVLAAVLATPYVFHYDLTVLALPLLWLAPWTGRTRILAALAWLSPVLLLLVARLTSLQLGPLLLLGLLALCLRPDE